MSQETEKGCLQGLGIGFGIVSAPFLVGVAILILIMFLCIVCAVIGEAGGEAYNSVIQTPLVV